MMLNIKFGLSSTFREMLKKEGLITSFYMEREIIGDYLIITFKSDSEKPEELVQKIKEEIKSIKIEESELERLKKVWISSEVMMIDNASVTLDNIASDIIEYGKMIPNKTEIFRSLNKKEYDEIISNIDFNNSSTLIIRPKKK